MNTAQVVAFIVASVGIVTISRKSLLAPRSHGFYRFFAFETILGLILLGIPCWFCEPFSWHQLTSWPLLTISLFLVIHGVYLLRQIGKPDEKRNETSLMGFEKTTRLVTSGAYRYIRHPLYSALLFLGWGAYFKNPGWLSSLLVLAATSFLVATAKMEEVENVRFFGDEYRQYMQTTRMFIPYLF